MRAASHTTIPGSTTIGRLQQSMDAFIDYWQARVSSVRHSSGCLLSGPREVEIVNFDKLTYAGNLENLDPVAENPRYRFVHGDICDRGRECGSARNSPDAIVHFAAESHVDRSIFSPQPVFETNLRGNFTLLEAARRLQRTPDSCTSRPMKFTAVSDHRWCRREFPAARQQSLFGLQGRAPTYWLFLTA